MAMYRLLTLQQAAEYLQLSPRSLYNQRYRGEAPGALGIGIGGRVRYRAEDLEEWLDEQQKGSRLADRRLPALVRRETDGGRSWLKIRPGHD